MLSVGFKNFRLIHRRPVNFRHFVNLNCIDVRFHEMLKIVTNQPLLELKKEESKRKFLKFVSSLLMQSILCHDDPSFDELYS